MNEKTRTNETALATLQRGSEALAHAGCRFYGKNGMFGELVSTGGNQCALVITSHAPCQMEIAGQIPNETICPLRATLGALLNPVAAPLRGRGRMMGIIL